MILRLIISLNLAMDKDLLSNLVNINKSAGFAEVKIGYDHTHGSDPTTGFDKQKLGTFTLKVKI